MAYFRYRAKNGVGEVLEGGLEGRSSGDVADRLGKQGLFPLSVVEDKKKSHKGVKIPLKVLLTFTRQLATLINSGATLMNALLTLKEETESKNLNVVLSDIVDSVKDGMKFSDALAKHPRSFSQLYVSLVKAAEASGTLGENFLRIADILEDELDFRSNLSSILIYPTLIFAVGVLTIFILLRFIVPKIVSIFEELGQALPAPTLFIINLSEAFSKYWFLFVLLLIVLFCAFRVLVKNHRVKSFFAAQKLKVFLLGDLIKQIEICNVARTLGVLLRNGVPIAKALNISSRTADNEIFRNSLSVVQSQLEKGIPFFKALAEHGIFPKSFINVVKVGEKSGALDNVLIGVSQDYKKDVNRKLKALMNVVEPMIILTVGIIVGFVVIAMLLPIFEIDFAF